MNLLTDPWLTVRRRSGRIERIAPWQVTDDFAADSVVALATPRADLDAAAAQLLIGLLQVAMPPEDDRSWGRRFTTPPTADELRTAFAPFAPYFELDGEGPRFLQDLTLLSEPDFSRWALEDLVLDSGLSTPQDLFRKAGTLRAACPRCAALILLSVQLFGPSGGRGHRTGLRGAGPLTTLVVTDESLGLWPSLWANVLARETFETLNGEDLPRRDLPADCFPWLAPTRTSPTEGAITTAGHVHPGQMFWAMGRRLRLEFVAAEPGEACDLCTEPSDTVVREVATRHHGVNYSGFWRHPFSPLRRVKDGQLIPVRADRRSLAYRNWLGLVTKTAEQEPAPVVAALERRRHDFPHRAELWTFGPNFSNRTAVVWVEGRLEYVWPRQDEHRRFADAVGQLLEAAGLGEYFFTKAIGEAMALDRAPEALRERFSQETESAFFERAHELAQAVEADAEPEHFDGISRTWHRALLSTALAIFNQETSALLLEARATERVARAYKTLRQNFWGKKMTATLGGVQLWPEVPAGEETKA
ncbi:MAG: type I-E CRISPR-associated protein Cse1/CasA [Thermoanaerobaculia bacterium]|nr:type I-E CRISPR-associated protein Cse1/CasA [Thermoanaerobaculia bacterium]